ncbi:hypothetical protein C0Q70_06852 [Pomacea canaliculata]|uniref:Uncharacterized protein n=1 Tax=Pomacea canaliculata TaxID=400727 RepID=A0A2T7PDE9_POMCA|nr:hypothetical protein C0Q70_06852 [Pomacea canaliculata]
MAVGEELVSRPEQRAAQETGEVMNGFGRLQKSVPCSEDPTTAGALHHTSTTTPPPPPLTTTATPINPPTT